jgi:hypothetical protein
MSISDKAPETSQKPAGGFLIAHAKRYEMHGYSIRLKSLF